MGSSATMTCAGNLCVASAHGTLADLDRMRNPGAKARDVSKDSALARGLEALSSTVGTPGGKGGAPKATGKAYYYLWSLERVCVALGLETIGKERKDWYAWGAEVLLANQMPNGMWSGEFGACGADTCFALLFLRRANLAHDLSSSLSLGGRELRAGKLFDVKRPPGKPLESVDIGKAPLIDKRKRPDKKIDKRPTAGEEGPAALARELVKAAPERQGELIRQLEKGKGSAYTQALVGAIPKLEGSGLREARRALAERLARMKIGTLKAYLEAEEPELRRAAAVATTARDDAREVVPQLIALLSDREPMVERAAHRALKVASGKDFGPASDASRAERNRAIAAWRAWWATSK
jgi:hypothetical protein